MMMLHDELVTENLALAQYRGRTSRGKSLGDLDYNLIIVSQPTTSHCCSCATSRSVLQNATRPRHMN